MPENENQRNWSIVFETVVLAILLGSLVWSFPPDVNEAHYLAKAKHFHDREFCANDLFVTSHEAHWLFYATHGWLCRFLEFETVAWIGRILAWLVTAWGMVLLSRAFWTSRGNPIGLSLLIGGLTVILNLNLNLAGEWFVGGVEGKCYAYGFALAGVAFWFDGRLRTAWVCFGIACAFHIVVGLWFVIAATFACVIERVCWHSNGNNRSNHRPNSGTLIALLALTIAFLFFLIGFFPAITQNTDVPQATVAQASKAQSLWRLAHHQLATSFDRWFLFVPLVLAWAILWRANRGQNDRKILLLNLMVLGSLLISGCGILVSFAAAWSGDGIIKDISARVLTLYFFRLSDVLVPLGFVLNLACLIAAMPGELVPGRSAAWLAAALIALCVFVNFRQNLNDPRSRSAAQSIAMPNNAEQQKREIEAERNWIRTCQWIRSNTETESIFITPLDQQTFKWYAYRAELACRKDMPQDAESVVEWIRRIDLVFLGDEKEIAQANLQVSFLDDPFARQFLPLAFQEKLAEVATLFDVDYLVVEQRLVDEFVRHYKLPECIEQVYPDPEKRKSTFVVYRFR